MELAEINLIKWCVIVIVGTASITLFTLQIWLRKFFFERDEEAWDTENAPIYANTPCNEFFAPVEVS